MFINFYTYCNIRSFFHFWNLQLQSVFIQSKCWFFHPAYERHVIVQKYFIALSHEKNSSFLFFFMILHERAIAAREAFTTIEGFNLKFSL
jgi:hypothetical protein